MPKLHDLLCKHLLREALDPISTVEIEKPVAPLDEQRIDVYCELRSELPPLDELSYLGLVRRMAEVEKRFLIEPFSATPQTEIIDDNLRKKFNLHHGLKKSAKGKQVGKPVLWVLSPGRPDDVIRGYVGVPGDDWPSGFYRCAPELAMWIVVLSELPHTADTLLLRMMGTPTMQLAALRELDSLPLSRSQRQPWIDILADVRYLLDEQKHLSPEEQTIMTELRQRWEREKADLRTEGRTVGRAESILTLMRARGLAVSEPVQMQVLGCKDLTLLERWLVRAATAATDSEVVAAGPP